MSDTVKVQGADGQLYDVVGEIIGGEFRPYYKQEFGADGDATLVSQDNPLPVASGNKISTTLFNSRDAATLAAAATFQGVGEDVSNFGRVGVSITSDNATDGTLTMEVSHDNVNWGGPTRTWADTRFAQPHMWNIVEKYFRIKYENGTTEATNLSIQVQYSNNADVLLGHQLDESLTSETESVVVRSVSVGQDPNGNYINSAADGYVASLTTQENLGGGASFAPSNCIYINGYSQIVVEVLSDQDGVFSAFWYSDEACTDLIRTFTRPYSASENLAFFSAPVFGEYLKVDYTNGATPQTDFHLGVKLLTKSISGQLIGLTDFIPSNVIANLGRNVIVGKTLGGHYKNVGVKHDDSLKVDLPRTAFGEVLTASKTAQAQIKFPYGINSDVIQSLVNNSSGGSSVAAALGVATCTAAGTYPSFAQLRSLDTIRYGPGQGSEAEFTQAWVTGGVALSSQLAGPGDHDEGFFFGYNGTAFGVHHHSHGELEIRALTITAAATGSGNITITLDGTAVTVAITSGWTINQVTEAIKAAEADFQNAARGWEVHVDDSLTVSFISFVAEPAAGAFSFVDTDTTGVTAGAFVTTIAGVEAADLNVPQESWNIDTMDGSGGDSNPSGITLAHGATPDDTTLAIDSLNPYRITWQFLGSGAILYEVETPKNGWQEVHIINSGNHGAATSLRNPTLHLNMIVLTKSGYSGSNLVASSGSMAGFIQGEESTLGVRHSANGQKSITSTTQTNVLTLHSEINYNGTRNKINTYPDFMTVANEVTKTITVFITINPTRMDGTPNMQSVDAHTPVVFDTAGTTFVGGQQLVPFDVPGDSTINIDLSVLQEHMRPGDRWVFSAAKTTGGSSGVVGIGVTFKDRL